MSQLKSLQFDIFQRYSILATALAGAFPVRATPIRVLDVGSGPESLTQAFLPSGFDVTAGDVDDFGNAAIVQLGRGASLPFLDAAFDAVVCMDVLEHIPQADRARFLAELARVASTVSSDNADKSCGVTPGRKPA